MGVPSVKVSMLTPGDVFLLTEYKCGAGYTPTHDLRTPFEVRRSPLSVNLAFYSKTYLG